MELERLKSNYRQNKVVQAICDHLAAREKNQTETKLRRIQVHLAGDDFDFKKSEIIAAFRALEDSGCGRYVEGRHGWPSRFVWAVPSLYVSAAAKGQQTLERDASSDEDLHQSADDEELVEHSFVLRPDVVVSLELPSDLRKSEAGRLAAFIQALPFEEHS
jgi:hypothetical protein